MVVEDVVVVEVERLESIKDEVSHVLVHIGLQHTTVKAVDSASAVHHLARTMLVLKPGIFLVILQSAAICTAVCSIFSRPYLERSRLCYSVVSVVVVCDVNMFVAKRCVLEQKLLLC